MVPSKEIITHEENCAQCQICQLICSYTYHKVFAPDRAYIQITTHDLIPTISFLEECNQCFKCAQHCLYGALKLKEVEE